MDRLWILLSTALVFLMQFGFLSLEVGLVQGKTTRSAAFKNLVDWLMVTLLFGAIGFGFMFGPSLGGLIGTGLFGFEQIEENHVRGLGLLFLLFQVAFAGTAATIVSGGLLGRAGFVAYLLLSGVVAIVIYPVFGHWAWGSAFVGGQGGWLEAMGFRDFAGSTVVHSTGAWIALVAAVKMGPRLGRFEADGTPVKFETYSFAWAAGGVLLLWLGWWGFNGGSALAFDDRVDGILLNTNLAAAMAGVTAYVHAYAFQGRRALGEKLLGGLLGGLVAITAGCVWLSPLAAIAVGACAGALHNVVYEALLYRFRVDDPVGVIPVHGACGVLGTLAVAFGHGDGLTAPWWTQLGIQAVGVLACLAWTVPVAWLAVTALEKTVGLRVSPAEERAGVHLGDFEEPSWSGAPPSGGELDEATLAQLMGFRAGDEVSQ